MTAFQIMILSGFGLPEIPIGGSEASRLKSRMRRLLAVVLWDKSARERRGNRRQALDQAAVLGTRRWYARDQVQGRLR